MAVKWEIVGSRIMPPCHPPPPNPLDADVLILPAANFLFI
jgi:hypothetical protein